ncbi:hypothetical protein LEP1GSC103_3204 [Leptospira borgpetersenii serovar Javanica str. UI 09931]|uniref:Uncharacterized protein n=3 Tax=Leptospira borgpetersenii TaxID=174 RepID=M3F7F0_LEPBO|nr:hypothetical protein [Leptospira borgpetersenii]EKQ90768.1 hypothetical protein LEP1GSC101_0640 [Leptospira borgpetersenii str. UI 09149]EMF97887.1 hypothetical protein LEP1GSC123_4182 [Leptospira borgpetersenii str. 200701203]EMN58801.1 hypothetical protein LEP1GSC090_1044 [Leptospira borgpetersenii serovar Javanica str. MK146]ENO63423.1 hypothetical protein LEP1GSC191_1966 [Leptospira borgpetersenii serovar Mini str. 201000851]EPG57890.1 hypothetical protein LEP1GSC103_3204 [Leptospira bo
MPQNLGRSIIAIFSQNEEIPHSELFNDSNEIRENIFEVNCVGFSKKRGV